MKVCTAEKDVANGHRIRCVRKVSDLPGSKHPGDHHAYVDGLSFRWKDESPSKAYPDKPIEFDPTSERHFPLLVIKAVEPGCATELQIEICGSGIIRRLTTTEDAAQDKQTFEDAVSRAFREAWNEYA